MLVMLSFILSLHKMLNFQHHIYQQKNFPGCSQLIDYFIFSAKILS